MSKISTLQSIRTKVGIFSALFLLSLLALFYLGGRYILVRMIRSAEQEVYLLSEDLKSKAFAHLLHAQRAATLLASETSTHNPLTLKRVQNSPYSSQLHLFVDAPDNKIQTAQIFDASSQTFTPLSLSKMAPYLSAISHALQSPTSSPTGIVSINDTPYYIAITRTPKSQGYILIGTRFNSTFISQTSTALNSGMSIKLAPTTAPVQKEPPAFNPNVFNQVRKYESGGTWHIGANIFEAVIPIADINGKELFQISITLPKTFSSLTTVAMGWLTMCIAVIGAVMIIPVLWIQARILLNPLTNLANKIRKISQNIDIDSNTYIEWKNKDELGIVAQSVNTLIETIDRKSAQLKQSDESQRAIIECLPDGLCVFNRAAHLVTIKRRPSHTIPFFDSEIGLPLSVEAFSFSDRSAFAANIATILNAPAGEQVAQILTRTSSSVVKIEARITRMSPKFVLVTLRDITIEFQQQQAQIEKIEIYQRKQKKAVISAFSAVVAHDLNTMLTIIQNATTLAQKSPKTNQDANFETIAAAIERGTQMAQDLMAFAGDISYSYQNTPPNDIITKNYTILANVISQNIIIDLNLADNLPQILADPQQLWKVFLNLVKNASEAMNNQHGIITITSQPMTLTKLPDNLPTHETKPTLGNGICFTIKDTGSGMNAEQIKRIFEPFYSTKSTKRGLGLPSAIHIIEAHKGFLQVDSICNHGTTFTIWLPAVATQTTSHDQAEDRKRPTQTTILFIEDVPSILQSTTILLKLTNPTYNIHTAANHEELIDHLRAHNNEITHVILDIHLQDMTPKQTIRLLKSSISKAKIIIASGVSHNQATELFYPYTFDDYIAKPYSITELNKKIANL